MGEAERTIHAPAGRQAMPDDFYKGTLERIAAAIAQSMPLTDVQKSQQRFLRHTTACRVYGNYQPPYEECTCGAEAPASGMTGGGY